MGRAKWRILHVPHGTARRFDAKGIQQLYRYSSAPSRTGNWKLKTYGILGAWAIVAARGKAKKAESAS